MLTFEVKNIGLVKEAIIEVGGLTVLTGENDTGKSTVCKAIFGLLKAHKEAESFFQEQQRSNILNILEELSSISHTTLSSKTREARQEIRHSINLNEELIKTKSLLEYLLESYSAEQADLFPEDQDRKKIDSELLSSQRTKTLIDRLGASLGLLKTPIEKQTKIEDRFKELLKSVFGGHLNSFNIQLGEININSLINVQIGKDGSVKKIDLKSEEISLPEATYIETPLIIQDFNFIRNSLFGRFQIYSASSIRPRRTIDLPYWKEDTVNKLQRNSEIESLVQAGMPDIYELIRKIIKGEIIYDDNQNDYIFWKEGIETSVKMTNTATGIKSFGLLQSLIQASAISSHSVLIIDEPEVHLHPKWQLEYAKILIKLAEVGVPVIVSSHSPYMIEALKTYSADSDIKNQTKFYYAEMTDEGSIFNDCSDDLEPIFDALSKPMRKLAFE